MKLFINPDDRPETPTLFKDNTDSDDTDDEKLRNDFLKSFNRHNNN